MRDRLIELLEDTLHEWECDVQTETLSQIADHLLANGVIVPPCKVGDTVYCLINQNNELDSCSRHICMSQVEDFSFEKRGDEQLLLIHLDFWDTDINPRTDIEFVKDVFGKTVFLTKEEAERSLAEWVGKFND